MSTKMSNLGVVNSAFKILARLVLVITIPRLLFSMRYLLNWLSLSNLEMFLLSATYFHFIHSTRVSKAAEGIWYCPFIFNRNPLYSKYSLLAGNDGLNWINPISESILYSPPFCAQQTE